MQINNIYFGDNLELLQKLEDNSIHGVVSDFPYNLGFMGKKWDTISNYQEWCNKRAIELLRVLKPGGYALIFGGTRTHHRLVCAFEDAGFEIKDEIQWIYGSGFPKSYNISKGFDKLKDIKLSQQWDGWGTALKPAQEPIMVAQKPIEKNYCNNIKKYGVGGLNIKDSRIQFSQNNDSRIGKDYKHNAKAGLQIGEHKDNENGQEQSLHNSNGRFPANIIFDEEASKILDEQTGILKSGSNCIRRQEGSFLEHGGLGKAGDVQITYGDSGGASRFFYCAKATQKDKNENGNVKNNHPTVKPTQLIKYLVRLITPPNGICLDICEGSGTHAKACIQLTNEGYSVNYIGFENDIESFETAVKRAEFNKNQISNMALQASFQP